MPSVAAASSTRNPISRVGVRRSFRPNPRLPRTERCGKRRTLLKDHGHVAVLRRKSVGQPAVNDDPPGGGLLQPGKQAERRRLAAAGRSHEDQQFVVADIQAEVVHGVNTAGKGLAQMGNDDRCHGRIVAGTAEFCNS